MSILLKDVLCQHRSQNNSSYVSANWTRYRHEILGQVFSRGTLNVPNPPHPQSPSLKSFSGSVTGLTARSRCKPGVLLYMKWQLVVKFSTAFFASLTAAPQRRIADCHYTNKLVVSQIFIYKMSDFFYPCGARKIIYADAIVALVSLMCALLRNAHKTINLFI